MSTTILRFIEMSCARFARKAQPLLGSRDDQDPLARSRRRFFLPLACRLRRRDQYQQRPHRRRGAQPAAVDKLARVEMNPDTSFLTAEEREVVNLLIQAADLMNPSICARRRR